jgi:ribosomal protein S18 acetylase RimI-like enzyme
MSVHRRAQPEDAPRLAEIATAAYSVYLPRMPEGVRPRPMTADYAAHVRDDEVWVVDDGNAILGFVVLVPPGDHLLLDNVAVDPSAQGRGIGAGLLALAEDRARAAHLPEVRLFTHVAMVENQARYERLGYRETGRARSGDLDRVHYTKQV